MGSELADQESKETAFARKQAAVEKTKRIQNRVGWALAVCFVGLVAGLGYTVQESYRTAEREAGIFASLSATAFGQGYCDLALKLAVAGLPPGEGASPISFRSRRLQSDLSSFGSAHDCFFQLALIGHTGLVNSVGFSPDGSHIVTASWDRTAGV
jgi:hypothetical protein